MNHYPEKVKEKLVSIISDMAQRHWIFSNHPGHDFMRQNTGKLSFSDTMRPSSDNSRSTSKYICIDTTTTNYSCSISHSCFFIFLS